MDLPTFALFIVVASAVFLTFYGAHKLSES